MPVSATQISNQGRPSSPVTSSQPGREVDRAVIGGEFRRIGEQVIQHLAELALIRQELPPGRRGSMSELR